MLAFAAHVRSHTVVLPRQRVLFLPMPKAACTSVLWTLAELAGMTPEDFEGSTLPEPSAALTVHDMNAWAPDHRFARYEGEARRRILEEDWLRFTVVRDPWHRLWSAWVSKLLLREPRFVATHGEQPWFPPALGQFLALPGMRERPLYVLAGAVDVPGVPIDAQATMPRLPEGLALQPVATFDWTAPLLEATVERRPDTITERALGATLYRVVPPAG